MLRLLHKTPLSAPGTSLPPGEGGARLAAGGADRPIRDSAGGSHHPRGRPAGGALGKGGALDRARGASDGRGAPPRGRPCRRREGLRSGAPKA
eukprot:23797-Prorocentrum_minimum.AAC.1